MGRVRAKTPSPAMVVAIAALVFSVVGTAAAGVATISVLSKKEKKQTRNIAKAEINKAAPGLSVANAAQLGGQPASFYAPATTLRTATVAGNGTVDGAHSDGVSQGNVTRPTAGLYCINGLSPAPRSAVASLTDGQAPAVRLVLRVNPATGSCAGSQIDVAALDNANNLLDRGFMVFIH
jgi:hypothetical protein